MFYGIYLIKVSLLSYSRLFFYHKNCTRRKCACLTTKLDDLVASEMKWMRWVEKTKKEIRWFVMYKSSRKVDQWMHITRVRRSRDSLSLSHSCCRNRISSKQNTVNMKPMRWREKREKKKKLKLVIEEMEIFAMNWCACLRVSFISWMSVVVVLLLRFFLFHRKNSFLWVLMCFSLFLPYTLWFITNTLKWKKRGRNKRRKRKKKW